MFDTLQRLSPEKAAILKTALANALAGGDGYLTLDGRPVRKDATDNVGVTSGLGLLPVPLQAPAKLLYPVVTPLRNMIPRNVVGGPATTFRQITGINTKKLWGSVAEATTSTTGRNSHIAFNEKNVTVNFKTIEQENILTPEAQFGGNWQGQNFNTEEFATLACLQATMQAEERILYGGNVTALGSVSGIAKHGTQQTAGTGSLTANTAYYFYVTPLTYQGYFGGAVGQVGGTDSPGEGTGTEQSLTTAASGAGDKSVTLTWTAIAGAAAYNVFVGSSTGIANAKYHSTVFKNYAIVLAVPGSGNRPNAADQTANALDYDGLLKLAATGTNAYYKSMDGVAMAGDNKLGVDAIEAMFQSHFNTYKTGVDLLVVHAFEKAKIDALILGSTAPYVRIEGQFGDANVKAGMGVKSLLNRYTGKDVEVMVHPDAAPGTIIGVTLGLGDYYPNARIASNLEVQLCWDYRKIDYAMSKRAREFGIDCRGALVNYAPFAMGVIQNIG